MEADTQKQKLSKFNSQVIELTNDRDDYKKMYMDIKSRDYN
jgi:hypothetical protein